MPSDKLNSISLIKRISRMISLLATISSISILLAFKLIFEPSYDLCFGELYPYKFFPFISIEVYEKLLQLFP